MPKALNRVQFNYMHFWNQKTYKRFTALWHPIFPRLRRKIIDDVQDPLVVLPLHLCSHCFFVAGLQTQKRPTFAACALSDMWEPRA